MKQIDTGGASFSRIREENKYFVDKSLLIKEILDTNDLGVNLFTRPRRFGKTTNLTMLDAFFNIAYKGNNWFDGLKISEYPQYDEYKNAFPVVYLNLKDTVTDSYDSYLRMVKTTLEETFQKHRYLLESEAVSPEEKTLIQSILDMSVLKENMVTSIKVLCRALQKHHGRKVVILIDEYDRAVQDAFGSESHRPMMNFLGNFLSATLKNNEYTQLACVTGVMRIAKASIFSGLNNLDVYDIFSKKHDEMFGFTEDEVKELFEYYGHPEKFPEAKEWYDGYRFGDVDVYNPYSVMKYVGNDFEPKNYWGESSSNVILKELYDTVSIDNMSALTDLTVGKTINRTLTDSMSYDQIMNDEKALFSIMAMAGYINAKPCGEGFYEVSLPNAEVKYTMTRILADMVPINDAFYNEFVGAVIKGNGDKMVKTLGTILGSASYWNLDSEKSYELVVMTMLASILKHYDVRTESEMGNGRADISLISKRDGFPNIIFELKKVSSEKELESAAEDAIEQIHDKHYYLGMKGKVVLHGLSFCGKIPCLKTETLDL